VYTPWRKPGPSRGWGRGVSYPGPRDVWRASPSVINIKYARIRMYHFKKKNSKISSPERPRENVWGPRENVSPGPAVALNGPGENFV